MSENTTTAERLDALVDLRQRIEATQAELKALRSAPAPEAEIACSVAAWVDRRAGEYAPPAADFVRTGSTGEHFALLASGPGSHSIERQVESLMCAMFGAELKRVLTDKAKGAVRGDAGPPAAERGKRLRALEDSLGELEVAEERAVRELEAAGELVDRRPTARAELVLAADGAL